MKRIVILFCIFIFIFISKMNAQSTNQRYTIFERHKLGRQFEKQFIDEFTDCSFDFDLLHSDFVNKYYPFFHHILEYEKAFKDYQDKIDTDTLEAFHSLRFAYDHIVEARGCIGKWEPMEKSFLRQLSQMQHDNTCVEWREFKTSVQRFAFNRRENILNIFDSTIFQLNKKHGTIIDQIDFCNEVQSITSANIDSLLRITKSLGDSMRELESQSRITTMNCANEIEIRPDSIPLGVVCTEGIESVAKQNVYIRWNHFMRNYNIISEYKVYLEQWRASGFSEIDSGLLYRSFQELGTVGVSPDQSILMIEMNFIGMADGAGYNVQIRTAPSDMFFPKYKSFQIAINGTIDITEQSEQRLRGGSGLFNHHLACQRALCFKEAMADQWNHKPNTREFDFISSNIEISAEEYQSRGGEYRGVKFIIDTSQYLTEISRAREALENVQDGIDRRERELSRELDDISDLIIEIQQLKPRQGNGSGR